MARTELTVQTISRAGLEATTDAAIADGHKFVNDGKLTLLHVINGATDVVVTVQTAYTLDGKALADDTVTCTANEERFIGPFPADIYNQTDGMVYIDYDDTSNVTVSVLRLGV